MIVAPLLINNNIRTVILINVLLEELVYINPLGTNATDLDGIFEIWKNFARIDTINLKWEKNWLETFATDIFSEFCSFIQKFLNFDCDYNFDCSKKNLKQIRQNMYDVLKENSINY